MSWAIGQRLASAVSEVFLHLLNPPGSRQAGTASSRRPIPSLHCLEAGVGQGVNSSVQNFGMQVETADHWARSTVRKRDCNIDWLVAEEITQLDRRLPLFLANHGQLRGHSGAAGAQALPAAHGHQPGHQQRAPERVLEGARVCKIMNVSRL